MSMLTQPIKWHGGKHYLSEWIIGMMPPHTHYVEPFFGGGSVLLRKPCSGVSEVVNDLNGWLVNFWRVLSDSEKFSRFQRHVEGVPFSERMFDEATEALLHSGMVEHDPMSAAVAFFVAARQSRQGLMKDFATMSRTRTRRGMNEQVSSWLTAIEGLPDVHARLKRVAIFNRPALDVIRQQDGPDTLFYLDPPYLHETRVTTKDYQHEMTPEQHVELLNALTEIKGRFILSGYPSAAYKAVAHTNGWHCVTREIDNKASSAKTKQQKTECLWMNYEPEAKR